MLTEDQCQIIIKLDDIINKHGMRSPLIKAHMDDCMDYKALAVMQLWLERKRMLLTHSYDRVFQNCLIAFMFFMFPGLVGYIADGFELGFCMYFMSVFSFLSIELTGNSVFLKG